MNKLPEIVTTIFSELFIVLHTATDDLEIAGAEANLSGDFSQVANLNDLCQKLQILEADIKSTVNNFDAKYSYQREQSTFHKNKHNRTRKPNSLFRVKVSGQTIEESTIAQTFLKTLRIVGFDRVAKLNLVVTKIPLLAKTPTTGYQTLRCCDGWYITTHVNKHTATAVLADISKQLTHLRHFGLSKSLIHRS